MSGEVGFEDVTLVVSSLHPVAHEVLPDKDVMNDTIAGYTRTAAFNMVMISDHLEGDKVPTILHFQVICNFRKVIGQYVLPFHKYLSHVAQHARHYLNKWHQSMQSVYAGKTEDIPTVCNRWAIFLDDTLEYSMVTISNKGKHKQSLAAEYLLCEVNVSRTLSLSMFINSIVKLLPYIKFIKQLSWHFACSFLLNPFWFDWSMSTLIKRARYQRGVCLGRNVAKCHVSVYGCC